jgi:Predicted sugar phosphatases of the HAD superfamily
MKIKKLEHLSKIFQKYDAFIVDLWGVMHNGIILNSSAINAVKKLEANGKRVVFLSNAPRPTRKVV